MSTTGPLSAHAATYRLLSVKRMPGYSRPPLAKASASIAAMVEAFSEQLITIDELRARMPHLRAREASLRARADALNAPTRRPRGLPQARR